MGNPTAAQRTEFAGSFSYNVRVLISTSRLYFREGATMAIHIDPEDPKHAAADALFETLLVRLRAFDSFFGLTANHPHADDAVSSDWIPSPTANVLTVVQRTMVNKRLAHLTYVQPPTHEWPIGDMVRSCCDTLRAFLADLIAANSPLGSSDLLDEVEGYLTEHSAESWDEIWTENDNHAHRRT